MNRFACRFVFLLLAVWVPLQAGNPVESVSPVAIKRTAPFYPIEMRRERISGSVVVEFIVGTDGSVKQTRVVRSTRREFEAPAVQAIQTWQFQPGTIKGRPVNVLASQTLEFNSPRAWAQPYEMLLQGKTDEVTLAYWKDAKGRLQRIEVVAKGTGEAVEAARAILTDEETNNTDPVVSPGQELRATYNFGVDQLSKSSRDILKMLDQKDPGFARPAELDKPVVVRAQDAAIFPVNLRETETKGEATVEFFIDRQGVVQLPHAVSASREEFGFAAAQAVAQWRFAPPLRKGKPVIVRVRVPIEFRLEAKS